MKKSLRKLSLAKETVLMLGSSELQAVAGGYTDTCGEKCKLNTANSGCV